MVNIIAGMISVLVKKALGINNDGIDLVLLEFSNYNTRSVK